MAAKSGEDKFKKNKNHPHHGYNYEKIWFGEQLVMFLSKFVAASEIAKRSLRVSFE